MVTSTGCIVVFKKVVNFLKVFEYMAKSKSVEYLKPGIDLDSFQKRADKRIDERNRKRKREHLQPEFDINIKESYAVSIKLCKHSDEDIQQDRIDHLESVLSAGPCRY